MGHKHGGKMLEKLIFLSAWNELRVESMFIHLKTMLNWLHDDTQHFNLLSKIHFSVIELRELKVKWINKVHDSNLMLKLLHFLRLSEMTF